MGPEGKARTGSHPFPDAPDVEHLEILELLGRGGMGAVYKAIDHNMGRPVAVKCMLPDLYLSENNLTRFLREANSLIALSHPNIVKGYEVIHADDRVSFTMEYVEGKDLHRKVKESGPLPPSEVVEIAKQTTSALSYAFSKGKIHRDIKPSNLLQNDDGRIKLTDFGLIKGETDPALTGVSIVLGTPHYMSPEVVSGDKPIDVRSDIYSLGATLIHLLTGRPPFSAKAHSLVFTLQITDCIPIPHEIDFPHGEQLKFILAKMVAKPREMRYQNPDDLLSDLDALGDPDSGRFREAMDMLDNMETATAEKVLFFPSQKSLRMRYQHPVLPSKELDSILEKKSSLRAFSPGEVLFYEDDDSRDFYTLVSGRVEVLRSGKLLAVIDKPGSFFGEISAVLDVKRTATIRSVDESICQKIAADDFYAFLIDHPEFMLALLESALQRLCDNNTRYVESQELILKTKVDLTTLLRQIKNSSEERVFVDRLDGIRQRLEEETNS